MVVPDKIQVKRIYDSPKDGDGFRVLVDRLWPRGIKKNTAKVDLWAQQIAPTTELRKWFAHDPTKFTEFRNRYSEELRNNTAELLPLIEGAEGRTLTLLYAARDFQHNHAVVLQSFLSQFLATNS